MIFWDVEDDANARCRNWTLDPYNGFIESWPGWKAELGHIWLQVWDEALDGRETALRALWVLRHAHREYFESIETFVWGQGRFLNNVNIALDQLEQDRDE